MMRTSPYISLALAGILTAMPAYSAAPVAQGQTCGQIVDAFNSRTQSFRAEADQKNMEFVVNDIFRGNDYKERWDKLQQTQEMLNDMYLCLARGGPCVKSARERLSDKVKEWFDGLTAEAGLNATRDRVLEAKNLIQTYTDRVLGITTDTMTAMQQCTSPMPGQPRLSANSVPPAARLDAEGLPVVDEPPSKPVETPQAVTQGGGGSSSGGGAGKMIGILAGAGAAVGGLLYYQKTMEENEALLRDIGNLPVTNNNNQVNPPPPTGVRAFDGTYDFIVTTTGPGGTQTDRRLTQYLRINNGALSGSDGALNGTVTASGTVTAVGACPINNDPADWTGAMLANGTGSGTYRCRTGGISRGWRADTRR
jgi:hypothetical protein